MDYRGIIQIFKCMNYLPPSYLSDKFYERATIHHHNSRNRNDLVIPKFQTSTGRRKFHYRAAKLWNNLDNSLKSINDVKTFKLALIRHSSNT